ncbi:hypothetical protein SDC9_205621 [bioreactor metagenome]|uniref:DUF3006 domain-containing protein n=1 Tax=bioreactor metagenome TaxID=1076179 RepID=A0A645J2K4_9ZZZZ
MMLIIDRFERNSAVCETEDGSRIEIDRSLIPEQSREGDVLIQNETGEYQIDSSSTKNRRQKARALLDGLVKDDQPLS